MDGRKRVCLLGVVVMLTVPEVGGKRQQAAVVAMLPVVVAAN